MVAGPKQKARRTQKPAAPSATNSPTDKKDQTMNDIFSRPTQINRQAWLDLAERCMNEEGPGKEIEQTLLLASGWEHLGIEDDDAWVRIAGDDFEYEPPRLAYSVDAITALIERELPGSKWAVWTTPQGAYGELYPSRTSPIRAATPARALCAAFCRAMAEKSDA